MRKRRRNIEPENAIYYNCDLCGLKFQFGPHVHDGKWLNHYKMTLCMPCYQGNWDGFAPHYEGVIERHLAAEGIPLPKRNSKGWYPRG
jgi:hypothetical protein